MRRCLALCAPFCLDLLTRRPVAVGGGTLSWAPLCPVLPPVLPLTRSRTARQRAQAPLPSIELRILEV